MGPSGTWGWKVEGKTKHREGKRGVCGKEIDDCEGERRLGRRAKKLYLAETPWAELEKWTVSEVACFRIGDCRSLI